MPENEEYEIIEEEQDGTSNNSENLNIEKKNSGYYSAPREAIRNSVSRANELVSKRNGLKSSSNDEKDHLNDPSINDNSDLKDNKNEENDVPGTSYDRGKKAFEKTLDNKNYYKDKKDEDKERLENAKGKYNKAKESFNNSKDSDDKQEKKDAKKEKKEAKKELNGAKKEAKETKQNEKSAKGFALAHPLEALKMKGKAVAKNAAGAVKDKASNAVKSLWKALPLKVKAIIIGVLVGILALIILIAFIYNYIDIAIKVIDEPVTEVANYHEKVSNFLNGMGFQNTEDAFYEELKYLNEKYDNELDIPLLMATLFYDDVRSMDYPGYEIQNEIDGSPAEIGWGLAYASLKSWVKDKIEESQVTIGEDGLKYSAGKIYRLRKLAKNQFETEWYGAKKTTEKTIGLSKYIENNKQQIGNELYQLFEDLIGDLILLTSPTALTINFVEDLYNILGGAEVFETTQAFGELTDNSITHVISLIKELFTSITDITGVTFFDTSDDSDCDEMICIKYRSYEFSEDNYFNYLKKHYIRYMPEFKKYVGGDDDAIVDSEIDKIIDDIKLTAESYQDIFGYQKKDSEFYTEICPGNIKKILINELGKPTDYTGTPKFDGANAFGVTDGKMHKGLDLNSSSTGNKEGDSVYSVYDSGKVKSSTKDETYKCTNCKGGWLEIDYTATLDDGEYEFTVVYGGLSPDSITLNKDDTVSKGTEIGKIGSVDDSDNELPSLHFAFYTGNSSYLDPTNIFVECTTSGTGGKYSMPDYPNAEKIANAIVASDILDDEMKQPVQLAGILANLNEESNNPDYVADPLPERVQIGYSESTTTGGLGISQWSNSRNVALRNYAASIGTTWNDFDAQINFLLTEYSKQGGGEATAFTSFEFMDKSSSTGVSFANYEGFIGATDAKTSTAAYAYSFERCGSCRISDREKLGEGWYEIIKSSYVASADTGQGIQVDVNGQTGAYGMSNQEKLNIVFPNGVPQSESELMPYLTDVQVPITTKSGEKGTTTVTVHKAIAQDVVAALTAAQNEGFKVYEIGGYRTFGSDGAGKVSDVGLNYSQHCYGLAVDLNVNENCYQKPPGSACTVGSLYAPGSNEYSITTSGALYQSFINNGWGWGGEWNSLRDYMHFSFFGT